MVAQTIAYLLKEINNKIVKYSDRRQKKGGKKMLERIKELCAKQNMPIVQLEKDCGLSNGSIYHWDEIKPSFDKVMKVAKRLGVSVEQLAGGEE